MEHLNAQYGIITNEEVLSFLNYNMIAYIICPYS